MNIRKLEDGFEFQSRNIFESFLEEYKEEQEINKANGDAIDTFSAWLWNNTDILGEAFYERFDEYIGVDKFTNQYNFED